MAYISFPSASAASVSGDGLKGYTIGAQLTWESGLQKISTVEENFSIPNILKGSAIITVIIPPSGYEAADTITALSSTVTSDLWINGYTYGNTYHSGGQVGTQEFGEGQKSLTISKIFTIFGQCATAIS